MRPISDVKKYCDKKGSNFNPDCFHFTPTGLKNDEKENLEEEEEDENNPGIEKNEVEVVTREEALFVDIPRTFEESQLSPERDHWEKAMCEEIDMMNSRNVWILADLPLGCKVIGSRWVYTLKTDDKNDIKRYKARPMTRSFNQRNGIDYYSACFSIIKVIWANCNPVGMMQFVMIIIKWQLRSI